MNFKILFTHGQHNMTTMLQPNINDLIYQMGSLNTKAVTQDVDDLIFHMESLRTHCPRQEFQTLRDLHEPIVDFLDRKGSLCCEDLYRLDQQYIYYLQNLVFRDDEKHVENHLINFRNYLAMENYQLAIEAAYKFYSEVKSRLG